MEAKLIRTAAHRLSHRLNRRLGKSGTDLQKMNLGMEIILINITKITVIYLLAALFGVVLQTLVIQGAYIVIKRYSFGLHALNSTMCTLVSSLMFVILPWSLQGVGINNAAAAIIFIPIILCLYLYAPADTKAKPLVGPKNRAYMKKMAVTCGFVLMGAALLIPVREVTLLITLGAVYQCVAILPLTYKILGRSTKNYGKYENKMIL